MRFGLNPKPLTRVVVANHIVSDVGVQPKNIAKNPSTNVDWKNLVEFTKLIKNANIRNFTRSFLELKVPDYFARIAASSTGKYHPSYTLGYGGLLRHTLAVTTICYSFISLKYLGFNQVDKDLIIAACLLHDTFKQGVKESGHTINNHPLIAAREIVAYGKGTDMEHYSNVIAGLLLTHMGQWWTKPIASRGQFVVHLSDYLASRPFLITSWGWLLSEIEKGEHSGTRQ